MSAASRRKAARAIDPRVAERKEQARLGAIARELREAEWRAGRDRGGKMKEAVIQAQSEGLTVGMVDPLGQVVRECAYVPKMTQKGIALTYAFALRQDVTADFGAANRAIIATYGVKGLNRIKALAWDYASGKRQP